MILNSELPFLPTMTREPSQPCCLTHRWGEEINSDLSQGYLCKSECIKLNENLKLCMSISHSELLRILLPAISSMNTNSIRIPNSLYKF